MLIAEQPTHRLRAGPGDLGQRCRHPGLPHPVGVIGHTDLLVNEGRVGGK